MVMKNILVVMVPHVSMGSPEFSRGFSFLPGLMAGWRLFTSGSSWKRRAHILVNRKKLNLDILLRALYIGI
jgi:hypothetical protein